MTGAQKSRLPEFQFAGFAFAPYLPDDATVGAADFGGRHAVFFEGRRLADEIIPRGVLNGGGNILVAAGRDLRANHVADGFAQCDSVAVHVRTLGRGHFARKRFVFPFWFFKVSNHWKFTDCKLPMTGNFRNPKLQT